MGFLRGDIIESSRALADENSKRKAEAIIQRKQDEDLMLIHELPFHNLYMKCKPIEKQLHAFVIDIDTFKMFINELNRFIRIVKIKRDSPSLNPADEGIVFIDPDEIRTIHFLRKMQLKCKEISKAISNSKENNQNIKLQNTLQKTNASSSNSYNFFKIKAFNAKVFPDDMSQILYSHLTTHDLLQLRATHFQFRDQIDNLPIKENYFYIKKNIIFLNNFIQENREKFTIGVLIKVMQKLSAYENGIPTITLAKSIFAELNASEKYVGCISKMSCSIM